MLDDRLSTSEVEGHGGFAVTKRTWAGASWMSKKLDLDVSKGMHPLHAWRLNVFSLITDASRPVGRACIVIMTIAIALSVASFTAQTLPEFRIRRELGDYGATERTFDAIEIAMLVLFSAEYLARLLTVTAVPTETEARYYTALAAAGKRAPLMDPFCCCGRGDRKALAMDLPQFHRHGSDPHGNEDHGDSRAELMGPASQFSPIHASPSRDHLAHHTEEQMAEHLDALSGPELAALGARLERQEERLQIRRLSLVNEPPPLTSGAPGSVPGQFLNADESTVQPAAAQATGVVRAQNRWSRLRDAVVRTPVDGSSHIGEGYGDQQHQTRAGPTLQPIGSGSNGAHTNSWSTTIAANAIQSHDSGAFMTPFATRQEDDVTASDSGVKRPTKAVHDSDIGNASVSNPQLLEDAKAAARAALTKAAGNALAIGGALAGLEPPPHLHPTVDSDYENSDAVTPAPVATPGGTLLPNRLSSHAEGLEVCCGCGLTSVVPLQVRKLVAFALSPLNLIDLVAIIPFYVGLVHDSANAPALQAARVLRIGRVFSLLKITRHHSGLQVLATTMARSMHMMAFLIFFVCLAAIFFGALIFYAEAGEFDPAYGTWRRPNIVGNDYEDTPFKSIPHGIWWAVVTLSTTGYGDFVPTTGWGRFIGCIAMLSGGLVIALPVTVISANFAITYKEFSKQREARMKLLGQWKRQARLNAQIQKEQRLRALRVAAAAHADHPTSSPSSAHGSSTLTFGKPIKLRSLLTSTFHKVVARGATVPGSALGGSAPAASGAGLGRRHNSAPAEAPAVTSPQASKTQPDVMPSPHAAASGSPFSPKSGVDGPAPPGVVSQGQASMQGQAIHDHDVDSLSDGPRDADAAAGFQDHMAKR